MRINRGAGSPPRTVIVVAYASAIGALAMAVAQPGRAADDMAAARSLCQAMCGACETVDASPPRPGQRGGAGPAVAGMASDSRPPALKAFGAAWTAERPKRFSSGAWIAAPGSETYFALDDPAQCRFVAAYLRSVLTTAPET
jgi:cytochrome c2